MAAGLSAGRQNMKKTMMLAMLLAVAISASAQTGSKKKTAAKESKPAAPAAAAAPQGMPAPAPEMQKLTKMFVGRWKTEEDHKPSEWMPKGGKGKGSENVKAGPGGMSLITEYNSKGDVGEFVGYGIWAWSPEKKVIESAWSDNMTPGVMWMTGNWKGNDLVFTGSMMMNGKKVSMKQTLTDITDNSHTFHMYMGDAGKEKHMLTIKYTRSSGIMGKFKD